MKRRILYALGGLLAVVLLLVVVVYAMSEFRLRRAYADIPVRDFTFSTDSALVARGAHVAAIRGCNDCHGADFGGNVMLDDPGLGRLTASNLTAGRGGIASTYTAADWDLAIRHGVRPDGRPLLVMPSYEYAHLSDADFTALVAYLRSLPPVDREVPDDVVRPLGRVLHLAGKLPLIPAEMIDHTAPRPPAPTPGPTPEYGAYLAASCTGCHQPGLVGGPMPGPPGSPIAANLTPDSTTGIGTWSEDDFKRALREGIRPDGRQLNPAMPIAMTSQLTDEEASAIWQYLQTLPPVVNEDA